MTSDTLVVPPVGASRRIGAIVICVAMFAIYIALLQALIHVASPWYKALPMPAGAPAVWWRVLKNLALVGPADVIAGVMPVYLYCLVRRQSFADLGFNRRGTALAWAVVLLAQAGLIWFDSTLGPVGKAPGFLSPYALMASALVGPCAAFAEETFFRGFLMDALRRGGFGPLLQCVISGIFFGLAHFSYVAGPGGWSIPVFTGALGVFWSFVYVLGKRSLWPTIVAHIINDAVLIPSVFYLILSHAH